jgi:3-oxoadipate enol-lactonase
MPFVSVSDVTLHYRIAGRKGGRQLVFINSLGSDATIWEDVEQLLAGDFEMLFFDKRGHGLSEVTEAPYSIATFADDLLALTDYLGWARPSFCGISIGGIIAMHIAAHWPENVHHLILMDTAAKIGGAASWNARIASVERDGLKSIGEAIIGRWFTPQFRQNEKIVKRWQFMLERTAIKGYSATCGALRDADLSDQLAEISANTLVLAGSHDESTPPALVRRTAEKIRGSQFEIIENSGHFPCIEKPYEVASYIRQFLGDLT